MRRQVLLILAPMMVYSAAVDVQAQVAKESTAKIGVAPLGAADPTIHTRPVHENTNPRLTTAGTSLERQTPQSRTDPLPSHSGGCPASDCAGGTLTQSLSIQIMPGEGVACGNAAGHTFANAWARCFDLVAEGFSGAVTINSVTFSIEQATVEDINVNVNLYLDGDGCPASGFGGSAVLIGSASTVVGPADVSSMITLCFPGVEVAAGSTLIVEIENPDDLSALAIPGTFRTMNNNLGECDDSYIRTAACGVDDWATMASIGFPDAHLILIIEATTEVCGTAPVCGDGSCDCGEVCDGCLEDCGVCPVCGNGVREGDEECDGADADACPGDCQADCTCAIRGACCDPGGKASGCDEDLTEAECDAAGGTWLGEGTDCVLCVCAAAEGGPRSCSEEHEEPGCNDFACCSIVCEMDPFCCDGEWNMDCVDSAATDCADTCGNGLCGPLEDCGTCPEDCAACGGCPASDCFAGIMSQSTSMEIVPGTGVACGVWPQTTPNAWARCFNPIEEGWIPEADGSVVLTIESVDFGFETEPPADTGPIPIFVNVYLDLNGCPASGFGTGNTVLIGTAETVVSPGDAGVLLNAAFAPPLSVELPPGASLIVEYENQQDGMEEPFFGLWPGSNLDEQCGLTYLRAADCGVFDWWNFGAICFDCGHLVLRVRAQANPDCVPIHYCGDGICAGGEDCFGCPADCGVCPFCGDGNCDVDEDENCENCEADCGGCEDCDYDCDSGVLNQSTDTSDAGNQVACGTPDGTTENAWARCFDLSENGLDSDVEINSVTFGIQQATIEGIPVNVNLYIDGDGCPASGFGTDNATLLATESITVGPGDEGTLITVDFSGLVPPVVPAGSSLIVEVETTGDGTVEPLHFFRSRANDSGQCRANYLRTASCGNADWTDMASIGDPPFVDTHLVMSVSMSCIDACGDCPTDIDGSGSTGPFDLATLLSGWGPTFPGNCLDADGDGTIGPFDLAALLAAWGPCL